MRMRGRRRGQAKGDFGEAGAQPPIEWMVAAERGDQVDPGHEGYVTSQP